jgi:hypothetical protein
MRYTHPERFALRESALFFDQARFALGDVHLRIVPGRLFVTTAQALSDESVRELIEAWTLSQASLAAAATRETRLDVMSSYAAGAGSAQGAAAGSAAQNAIDVMSAYASAAALAGAQQANQAAYADADARFLDLRRSSSNGVAHHPTSLVGWMPDERRCALVVRQASKLSFDRHDGIVITGDISAPLYGQDAVSEPR